MHDCFIFLGCITPCNTQWVDRQFHCITNQEQCYCRVPCVHDRVVWCQRGLSMLSRIWVEGKLATFIPGNPVRSRLGYFVSHEPRSSRHVQVTSSSLTAAKSFVVSPLWPFTRCCCIRTSRGFCARLKSTEVVNPNDIVDFKVFTRVFNPPFVSILVHCFPSHRLVPPKVDHPQKTHLRGQPQCESLFLFSSFKEMWICPHIVWVFRYVRYPSQFRCGYR